MDSLFLQLCFYMQMTYNFNSEACQKALNAEFVQSGGASTYNLAQKYYENKLYSEVDRKYVYSVVGIGGLYNAYKTKDIAFSTPFKPFCEELKVDFNEGNQSTSVSLKWRW